MGCNLCGGEAKHRWSCPGEELKRALARIAALETENARLREALSQTIDDLEACASVVGWGPSEGVDIPAARAILKGGL